MSESATTLKSRLTARIVKIIISTLISTYQIDWITGKDKVGALNRSSRPMIVALWHNRILFLSVLLKQLVKQGFPITIMISMSKDGDLGANLVEMLGARVVRGSPSRGGTKGLRALYRSSVKDKHSIVILPDGSKGPIYEAKMGMMVLARMTSAPILPISGYASDFWRIKSWDRMIIPKPFSKVVIKVGQEMEVSRKADEPKMESQRQEAETQLNLLGMAVKRFYIDENSEKRHAI